MKKILSLSLVYILVLCTSFLIPFKAVAAYEDEGCFFFRFENETEIYNERITIPSSQKSFDANGHQSNGSMRLRYQHTGTANNQSMYGVSKIRLFPNETYKVSMWLKVNNPEMLNPPNVYLTYSYQRVSVYSDPLLQNKTNDTWTFDQFTVTADKAGLKNADGSCASGWHKIEYTFTFSGKMWGNKYQDYANDYCDMYLRFGNGNDNTNNLNNYRADYVAGVTDADGNVDYSKLYMDFSIDDLKMERITGKYDAYTIQNNFDMTSWQRAGDLSWRTTGTAERTTDVAAENQTSLTSLKISNNAQNNNGWTQLEVVSQNNNDKKIWTNRAYKVSYWAKASDAVLACENGKTQFIVQRLTGKDRNRLDRSKGRYEIVDMPALTSEWKKYEFIYYLPRELSLTRSAEENYYQYINIRQEGLPKNASNPGDYAFWIDDFKIEPLDIVYDGALNENNESLPVIYNEKYYPAENEPLNESIFGKNTVVTSDGSYQAASGAVNDRVLRVQDSALGFRQSVDVDNQKVYKVSFWAKGESYIDESGQTKTISKTNPLPVYGVFDRVNYGSVRDNAVTDANTEGYSGYGNVTEQEGDIPFYLYNGAIATSHDHQYNEIDLQQKDGVVYESLVYDDYYDRLKCVNTQEGNTPSAWNYQYINGVDTDATYQADLKDGNGAWKLTDEWQYYEAYYFWDYAGKHLRMPEFMILPRTSAYRATNATYSIADVTIEEAENLDYTNPEIVGRSDSDRDVDYFAYGFENGTGSVSVANGSAEIVNDSPSGNGSALKIVPTDTNAELTVPFGAVKDAQYSVSAWIKLESDVKVNGISLTFWNKAKGEAQALRNNVKIDCYSIANGQWIHVCGTFSHDGFGTWISGERKETAPIGQLTFSLSSNKPAAYVIDDLTIIPNHKGEQSYVSDNLISAGNFEGDAPLSTWHPNGSGTKAEIVADGANGTAHAMYVTGTTGGWANVTQTDVNIRFNKDYEITFWAKALNDETNGKNIDFILDRAGKKTDENVPSWEHLYETGHRGLTKEWRKYTIHYRRNLDTQDSCKPNIYFRCGSEIANLHFAVDEVEVHELGEYDVAADAAFRCANENANTITAEFKSTEKAKKYFYRVYAPIGTGSFNLVGCGEKSVNSNFTITLDSPVVSGTYIAINAIDENGFVGDTCDFSVQYPEYDENVSAEFCTMVWPQEIDSLTAEIRISGNQPKNVIGAIAFYDSENRLLGVSQTTEYYANGEVKNFDVTAPTVEGAVKAKLFCWDGISLKPLAEAKTIETLKSPHVFFIDPVSGDDLNDGTFDAPIQTLSGSKYFINETLGTATDDVYIVLKNGTYNMSGPFTITDKDRFASDTHNVIFTALENGKANLTGAKEITGFELYDANLNIFRAYVGTNVASREFFVNNVRGVKARSKGAPANCVNLGKTGVGITTTDTFLKNFKYPMELEFVFWKDWRHNRVHVEGMSEENGVLTITMESAVWSNVANNNTPVTTPGYYENALELLDEEGEWYLDTHEGYVYYKPRYFENIHSAKVTMPVAEQLLSVKGNTTTPRKNITFQGITFSDTTWNYPTQHGLVGAQNNVFGNGVGVPPGAIHMEYVDNVNFYNCKFTRMGSTALYMYRGIKNCNVLGNEFYDLSNNALLLGYIDAIDRYHPDNPEVEIYNCKVQNNYFHNIAIDYMSGTAISAGFPVETSIAHNELYSMPYSGMHTGWGWGSTAPVVTFHFDIANNYIHHVMNDKIFDGGAIYTLGNTAGTAEDPNTIRENYIHDVGNRYGALYPDEGSSFQKWSRNVVDLTATPKWYGAGSAEDGTVGMDARWLHIHTGSIHDIVLEENYTTTATKYVNGTNISCEEPLLYPNADWPKEAQDIIDRSGVEPAYQKNFQYGMQEVTLSEQFTVSVGGTADVTPTITTSKSKPYRSADLMYYVTTSDPSVVSVEGTTVRGLKQGSATVTVSVVENGILKVKHTTVVVS